MSGIAMEYGLHLTGLVQGGNDHLHVTAKSQPPGGAWSCLTLSFLLLCRLWAPSCCPNEQEDTWGSDESPWKVALAVFPAE